MWLGRGRDHSTGALVLGVALACQGDQELGRDDASVACWGCIGSGQGYCNWEHPVGS